MHVDSLEALFRVELMDVYDAEHRLSGALEELAERTNDEDIAAVFAAHQAETEQHVDRLEVVFDSIGLDPERSECAAMSGMVAEADAFYDEHFPSMDVGDRYAITAAQKIERYEITAYENLLEWATAASMGTEVTGALRANLDDEEAALAALEDRAAAFEYEKLTV